MMWISIDPASKTGIARWHGEHLISVATLRPTTKREAKGGHHIALDVRVAHDIAERRTTLFASEVSAWSTLLVGTTDVIAEEGFGASATTIKQHAFRRGFVAALCALRSIPFVEVNVSEWRKVVGAANDFSFPKDSALAKARAIELVRPMVGADVSADEADAVCAGLWALATRTVRP